MNFSLPAEIEDYRRRIRAFVEAQIMPLEADPASFDEHENIASHVLEPLRVAAKAAGLWALTMPQERGGQGLPIVGMAACYEEMNRSIFGPVVLQLRRARRRQHDRC